MAVLPLTTCWVYDGWSKSSSADRPDAAAVAVPVVPKGVCNCCRLDSTGLGLEASRD